MANAQTSARTPSLILIISHIVQWVLTGRTLAPVEPSESMEAVKHGVINAETQAQKLEAWRQENG